MALEVTVGPPVLTINSGHTFLVSELDGTVTPASDEGLYSADTRYLSGYQLHQWQERFLGGMGARRLSHARRSVGGTEVPIGIYPKREMT